MTTQTEQHIHTADCGHSHHHPQAPYTRESAKIGRNEPCPCESGKKFKKCCGTLPG